MITTNFLKRGDPVFVGAALKQFSFLEADYKMIVNGIAESYETVLSYENDHIRLQVVFSLPEAPFVVLQQKANHRIKKEQRYKPTEGETKRLIKEYNKYRDSYDFDVWFKKLRKGDFTMLINAILCNLATEIKNYSPWIEFSQN